MSNQQMIDEIMEERKKRCWEWVDSMRASIQEQDYQI